MATQGEAPTITQIGEAAGLRSRASVHYQSGRARGEARDRPRARTAQRDPRLVPGRWSADQLVQHGNAASSGHQARRDGRRDKRVKRSWTLQLVHPPNESDTSVQVTHSHPERRSLIVGRCSGPLS
ncbi:hypothetical protein ACFYWF_27340 [Streptomyces sp. NPDC003344]|uniref:hypothetical protein n=1 Tax=Streptomyces sp. NPDC003344 TaxID=3364682 RepID=UPI0036A1F009